LFKQNFNSNGLQDNIHLTLRYKQLCPVYEQEL